MTASGPPGCHPPSRWAHLTLMWFLCLLWHNLPCLCSGCGMVGRHTAVLGVEVCKQNKSEGVAGSKLQGLGLGSQLNG